ENTFIIVFLTLYHFLSEACATVCCAIGLQNITTVFSVSINTLRARVHRPEVNCHYKYASRKKSGG
ncbi:TPA: hypothetical protein ACYFQV_005640, partial [Klebsiella pneumoniae]